MEIAPNQSQELALINNLLGDLTNVYGLSERKNIREIQSKLNNWAARIAVIGQVKAGKSTFLNSFLHMDDFLPSDVNPWTSVVTNIRINLKDDPRTGASFEFFDEADWDEIIEGNSDVRKLSEELLPGFESGILKRQVEHMRSVAKARLGNHYQALLGQKHEFDFLTADLMKRYVCAGEDNPDRQDSQGRYATITKVANAYMRRPEFKVPVILTDTPGVNDPFLVRDEFTCRSLDQSDVFVVVLSAHQALTDVDVALIQLLARQDEKDVIVYINRIDEVENYATEVPKIKKDVTERLRAAVPDLEFSIVAGSAFMAAMAGKSGEEAQLVRDELDTPELHAYLESTIGHVPEDQIDRLYAGSGVEGVKKLLSVAIDNGIGAQKLDQIYQDTWAEVSAMLFSIKREYESVRNQLQNVSSDNTQSGIESLEAELESLAAVQAKIGSLIEDGSTSVEKLMDKSWTDFQNDLNRSVADFIEAQSQTIDDIAFRRDIAGKSKSEIKIDLTDLHKTFESVLHRRYQKARKIADVSLNNCLVSCQSALTESFSDLVGGVTLASLPHDDFVSTLTFAKKELALPVIMDRGWKFWSKSKVNKKQTLNALKEIAGAEFKPVVEKMTRAFNETLSERVFEGTNRIQVLSRVLDVSAAERGRRIRRDRRQLEHAAQDKESCDVLIGRLQTQLDILDRRIQSLSVIESSLQQANFLDAA